MLKKETAQVLGAWGVLAGVLGFLTLAAIEVADIYHQKAAGKQPVHHIGK